MAEQGKIRDLQSLLDALQQKVDEDGGKDKVTVEEVLRVVGRRAYGPLLLVIALASISPAALIPGSTWAFALMTLLVAAQLALHKDTPWLPSKALELKLSEGKLGKFLKAARPTARFVDRFIRERLAFLAEPPWSIVVALLCVLAAVVTFPLSLVPIAPLLPGIAIAFFGLGLTARDGVLLLLGAGAMGVAGWVLATRVLGG
jgi:hypothetical protein